MAERPYKIIDPQRRALYLCPECEMYSHTINKWNGRCLDCRQREMRERAANNG